MCIIVAKPAGKTVTKDVLATCFKHNSDGAGFMYSDAGQLHIEKGFFKFEEFYKAYEGHAEKDVVMHFRIRTHGATDAENCHPFQISKNLAFAHNGVIRNVASKAQKDKSDTFVFNEEYIKPFVQRYGKRILQDTSFQSIIEEYIGHSKLVFLDYKGKIRIYNENLGNEEDGVWFSNLSWKPREPGVQQSYFPNSGSTWRGNQSSMGLHERSQQGKKKKNKKPRQRWNHETNVWETVGENNVKQFPLTAGASSTLEQSGTNRAQNNTTDEPSGIATISQGDLMVCLNELAHTKWQFSRGDLVEVTGFGQTAGYIWVRPLNVGGDVVPECVVAGWHFRQATSWEADRVVEYIVNDDISNYPEESEVDGPINTSDLITLH